MEPLVSIVSLIYKSLQYADWVYGGILEWTPLIADGKAEFFFVANDPTERLLKHLQTRKYPHYVNINPVRTEEELLQLGYGKPEYISRVYRGYNEAIKLARGEVIVLINSDNYCSPGWLEGLLKYAQPSRVVCSKLVERPDRKHVVHPSAFEIDFGSHPSNFRKEAFLKFCCENIHDGIEPGGVYMPCLFFKDVALEVGLYPEGNLAGMTFDEILWSGDKFFFWKLQMRGVQHVTSLESLVYHTVEGEKDE